MLDKETISTADFPLVLLNPGNRKVELVNEWLLAVSVAHRSKRSP